MNIQTLLALVPDLSEERRAQLAAGYEAGTLSAEDKAQLAEYMFALMDRMEVEKQEAKALFGKQ